MVKISCAAMKAATFATELGLKTNENSPSPLGVETVIFDEISKLDPGCRRSLLYALPDGDMSVRPGLLTARLISATSRNLDEEMRAGRFRAALYNRINVVCLRLPPLLEHREDIPQREGKP
jgi:two-component system response regulator PilR (NtrC family)